jgi:hypothetical protein
MQGTRHGFSLQIDFSMIQSASPVRTMTGYLVADPLMFDVKRPFFDVLK